MSKFNDHESSHTDVEARMKWEAQGQPSLPECFSAAIRSSQQSATEVVNELICMMGQSVLRKLLCNIKRVTPHWFGIIADEATDVSNREQLNLSIRCVNDN